MEPVVIVTGRAVPLDRTDYDTDQIIRPTGSSGSSGRVSAPGCSRVARDRDFVLNNPEFVGATILVAGHNFGTGSSPRAAVWA